MQCWFSIENERSRELFPASFFGIVTMSFESGDSESVPTPIYDFLLLVNQQFRFTDRDGKEIGNLNDSLCIHPCDWGCQSGISSGVAGIESPAARRVVRGNRKGNGEAMMIFKNGNRPSNDVRLCRLWKWPTSRYSDGEAQITDRCTSGRHRNQKGITDAS